MSDLQGAISVGISNSQILKDFTADLTRTTMVLVAGSPVYSSCRRVRDAAVCHAKLATH
jgi:hypothetical protein